MLPPTDLIDRTPQQMEIDGVHFVFQYAPESEAPAELTFYLPETKAFCGAEIVSHNMHNLYTLRGAKVRDALAWSGYIDEAIDLSRDAEVVFASHHWPIWGNAARDGVPRGQRDTYKYIHDQTLRLANAGFTPREIAEQLELPESLSHPSPTAATTAPSSTTPRRSTSGTSAGTTATRPTSTRCRRSRGGDTYVEYMGGAEAVLEKARASSRTASIAGSRRCSNHLVFAAPDNTEARELLARSYDQLAYRAESGPWRDVYLTGASSCGTARPGGDRAPLRRVCCGTCRSSSSSTAMAVRIDGEKAAERT